MDQLFDSFLRQLWGDEIANAYQNDELTEDQLLDLENGFWVESSKGVKYNGMEDYA